MIRGQKFFTVQMEEMKQPRPRFGTRLAVTLFDRVGAERNQRLDANGVEHFEVVPAGIGFVSGDRLHVEMRGRFGDQIRQHRGIATVGDFRTRHDVGSHADHAVNLHVFATAPVLPVFRGVVPVEVLGAKTRRIDKG